MTENNEHPNQAEGPGQDHGEGDPASWHRLYLIVIGELVLLILLFYWFTISFS